MPIWCRVEQLDFSYDSDMIYDIHSLMVAGILPTSVTFASRQNTAELYLKVSSYTYLHRSSFLCSYQGTDSYSRQQC